jgi:hypothetical protein
MPAWYDALIPDHTRPAFETTTGCQGHPHVRHAGAIQVHWTSTYDTLFFWQAISDRRKAGQGDLSGSSPLAGGPAALWKSQLNRG